MVKEQQVPAVTRALRGANEMLGISAWEAIKRWDNGEILSSIEMGGIGPGYEQTIQVMAIEFLRAALLEEEQKNALLTFEQFKVISNAVVSKIDWSLGGVSGAQFQAATSLSWKAYLRGWTGMLEEAKEGGVKEDRTIIISRHFPKAP